jgi:hypothetical protein
MRKASQGTDLGSGKGRSHAHRGTQASFMSARSGLRQIRASFKLYPFWY